MCLHNYYVFGASLFTTFLSYFTFSYCGVEDPTWAEINHFVKFLDIQLNLCEKSIFCNRDFVSDVLDGFKNFVVKFMIRMSRVSCFNHVFTALLFMLASCMCDLPRMCFLVIKLV